MLADDEREEHADEADSSHTPLHAYKEGREDDVEGDVDKLKRATRKSRSARRSRRARRSRTSPTPIRPSGGRSAPPPASTNVPGVVRFGARDARVHRFAHRIDRRRPPGGW